MIPMNKNLLRGIIYTGLLFSITPLLVYFSSVLFLGEKTIIDKKLALRMGKAADFRNRVVHGYNDFDFKALFKDYREDLKDLRIFGSEILKYIGTSK